MCTEFVPKDEEFELRVRTSFGRQRAMAALGVTIASLSPGDIVLEMPYSPEFAQQHGFVHAGIIATALDSACGYAAFSLVASDATVLTAEFKINLLAPASGERFRFHATVVKPGRTLTVCDARAFAVTAGGEKLIATMTGTLMSLPVSERLSH